MVARHGSFTAHLKSPMESASCLLCAGDARGLCSRGCMPSGEPSGLLWPLLWPQAGICQPSCLHAVDSPVTRDKQLPAASWKLGLPNSQHTRVIRAAARHTPEMRCRHPLQQRSGHSSGSSSCKRRSMGARAQSSRSSDSNEGERTEQRQCWRRRKREDFLWLWLKQQLCRLEQVHGGRA